MHLTLKEAAEKAKMPTDELLRYIESDDLTAEWISGDEQYNISQDDLETFLSKKSFEAFWNDSNENEKKGVEQRPFANSGNLRRVLTAEAVAELKIEHRVLMSRVETLERLFSEFMEFEKAGKALILEDAWKIKPTEDIRPSTAVSDQAPNHMHEEQIVAGRNNDATEDTAGLAPAEALIKEKLAPNGDEKSEVEEPTQVKNDISEGQTISEEKPTGDTSQTVETGHAYVSDLTVEKQQSAKALLSKKIVNKSEPIQASDEGQQDTKPDTNTHADIEMGSSITLRLAEYERRLAEAKQTATKIWH